MTYDVLGRPTWVFNVIAGTPYFTERKYDLYGRVANENFYTGFSTQN